VSEDKKKSLEMGAMGVALVFFLFFTVCILSLRYVLYGMQQNNE